MQASESTYQVQMPVGIHAILQGCRQVYIYDLANLDTSCPQPKGLNSDEACILRVRSKGARIELGFNQALKERGVAET
eukprot:305690-Pelagomonas_calceolata.AAC.6